MKQIRWYSLSYPTRSNYLFGHFNGNDSYFMILEDFHMTMFSNTISESFHFSINYHLTLYMDQFDVKTFKYLEELALENNIDNLKFVYYTIMNYKK